MLIVQKYGGSSLATPQHLRAAAKRIADMKRSGMEVVVVASAMGHMTDHLLKLARKTVEFPPTREVDMLLTAGERISMSLLSMALQEEGIPAISFTGSQSGIITTNEHSNAKIIDLRPLRIKEELMKGKVVIIAGFQGVSEEKEITTLGRGGSDTTAVALAAVLKADRCEILTDVDGLFTADPRIVPEARILSELDYAQALEMAGLGAKMHVRSIELAEKYGVHLKILSSKSTDEKKGTVIKKKESNSENRIESYRVTGVTTKDGFDFFRITTKGPSLFEDLKLNEHPLRFIQIVKGQISMLCESSHSKKLIETLQTKGHEYTQVHKVSVISIVGEGINHSQEFNAKIFDHLSLWEENCLMFVMNSQSVSFVVQDELKIELAKKLHFEWIEQTTPN